MDVLELRLRAGYGVVSNRHGEGALPEEMPVLPGTVSTVATAHRLHSTPPGRHGGNLDVSLLGAGTFLHLPAQVPGGNVHVGDAHYAHGDGEVALTAFEAPLRATLRLSVTPADLVPSALRAVLPSGVAMRDCVRRARGFVQAGFDVDRATTTAWMSAAVDFSVSQVVDVVSGVHASIRTADLRELLDDGVADHLRR